MLSVYFADDQFQAGVEALRRAATAVCPVTGKPDRDALVIALGQHFDIWSGGLLSDPQAEPGYRSWPLPVPAIEDEDDTEG